MRNISNWQLTQSRIDKPFALLVGWLASGNKRKEVPKLNEEARETFHKQILRDLMKISLHSTLLSIHTVKKQYQRASC